MRIFNYSKIKEQKWDSDILGLIAAIYKEAGKQELYLKQQPEKPEKLVVHRMAFGYVRINDKDNPNEYILVPAWDFFVSHTHVWRQYENGTYVIREVPENYAIDSYLTINAIDGTVIDRAYGY